MGFFIVLNILASSLLMVITARGLDLALDKLASHGLDEASSTFAAALAAFMAFLYTLGTALVAFNGYLAEKRLRRIEQEGVEEYSGV